MEKFLLKKVLRCKNYPREHLRVKFNFFLKLKNIMEHILSSGIYVESLGFMKISVLQSVVVESQGLTEIKLPKCNKSFCLDSTI